MKRKKPNLNRAGNMNVDAWRNQQISKRVRKRIADETNEFLQKYADATDAELIELVRSKANELNRMPHPLEMPGGIQIHRRLGNWNVLALQLGWPPVGPDAGKKAYEQITVEEGKRFAAERRAMKEEKLRKRIEKAKNNGNTQ